MSSDIISTTLGGRFAGSAPCTLATKTQSVQTHSIAQTCREPMSLFSDLRRLKKRGHRPLSNGPFEHGGKLSTFRQNRGQKTTPQSMVKPSERRHGNQFARHSIASRPGDAVAGAEVWLMPGLVTDAVAARVLALNQLMRACNGDRGLQPQHQLLPRQR